MTEMRKQNAPKAFDIHRTLPAHRGKLPLPQSRHAGASAVKPQPLAAQPIKRTLKRRLFILFAWLIGLILSVSIFIAAWDAHNISAASQKMFGSNNLVALARGGTFKTDANGRVNVLIVGYSVDDPGHQGANLTDSILLLSMKPANHSGYLLSIPRDLYVQIPGHGYGKINEVYEDGGIGLLKQVVDSDFAVNVNYYAIVNYAAVKNVVNALGGITLNIQSPDSRGLYDPNISPVDGGPLLLKNGTQALGGQTALNLTRARGDPCGCGSTAYGFNESDFDRTQHQRQVFQAIKAKLNWKLILNPRQNSRILNAVATNVKTDIQIGEARALFGLFNAVPNSELQSLSLRSLGGRNLLQSYASAYAGDTLIPAAGITDFSQIDAAIQQLN